MKLALVALALALAVAAPLAAGKHVDLPPQFGDYCVLDGNENLYDPSGADAVKWWDVDLDAPDEERFVEIATHYKKDIQALVQVIKDLILPALPGALEIVHRLFEGLLHWIPPKFAAEIRGIANATDMPLGEIVLYNVFYEVFTVCTSIVAQGHNGTLYHARNLDFGLFLGWDPVKHEWQISEVLRKMIVNIRWNKGGKTLFMTNNFAGFVGAYNGLRPNEFTITANERFMLEGGIWGMFRYILGLEPNGKWMTWLVRDTLEEATNYAEAKQLLMETPILSPVYYILGGKRPFEGAIITRSLNNTDILTEMDPSSPFGWYLLQTNYDQGTEPLYLDDRDTPGHACMRKLGQSSVGFEGIYNVLASQTSKNKLTAYSVLMSTESNSFETHIQECPGDCWPF